jgi:DNA-binding transcriptional regulator YiaG
MMRAAKRMERNVEIREAKARYNLSWWEIAERAGVSENTLNRWMRQEMPDDNRTRVQRAIDDLSSRW